MKTMDVRKFKAQCLSLIDEVYDRNEEVTITKDGEPVATLVRCDPDEIFGFMRGKGKIAGDLISPVDAGRWNSEK